MGNDKFVVAAATHLEAKGGSLDERRRSRPGDGIEISCRRDGGNAHRTTGVVGGEVSVLLLGDFNSRPNESSRKDCPFAEGGGGGRLRRHLASWQFHSAYPLPEWDTSHEYSLFYITWKIRRDGKTRRIVGYIFYASHLTEDETVKDEDVETARLPGYRYPSDHYLLIAAKFEF